MRLPPEVTISSLTDLKQWLFVGVGFTCAALSFLGTWLVLLVVTRRGAVR